jgi:hypothetical protein
MHWYTIRGLVTIYNMLGQEVSVLVNSLKEPGVYEIDFSAGNLPTGIYFYRLNSGTHFLSRKLIIAK